MASKGEHRFFREHLQVIYAVALMALIPAAIVLNSFLFIRATQKVMNVELQRKAFLGGKVAAASLPELLGNRQKLQAVIEKLASESEDVRAIDVLVPEGSGFTIVASLDPSVVGKTSRYLYNTIATQVGQAIAYETFSPSRTTEEQSVSDLVNAEERFWVVVNPIRNSVGDAVALVSLKVSSKIIDDLTTQNLNRSILILVLTVVVVLLLVAVNTRLFQYAFLLKKLREVDAMKDEFVSMASHELRTPITGIKGYLQMILEGSFGQITDDVKKYLNLVFGAVRHLDDLVADLLDVSRIEQGRIQLFVQPVDLTPALRGAVAELTPPAESKGLKLKFEGPTTPLPEVSADVNKLKQVLINLIGNAVKYTKQGSVTVTAAAKEKIVELKVSDTGIGMSPEARERLFTKFYRIQSADTQGVPGTGLGLWITKQLVELMRGKIFVDSIEGKGTQVTVILPVAKAEEKR